VMVWLHGGAYAFGAGGDDPAALAPLGVVVVTLNYRLGIMGFMAHPALAKESRHVASGNYGLMDQIEALRWVKRNIAAFGGDPDRVTVFGHSAGGASVLQLMASPLARGLFHRAISQSGGNGETRSRAEGEAQALAVAERLGAPTADPIAFLRAQPAARLVAAATGPFDPTVDGWVLPEAMPGALRGGRGSDLPLILGATANEAGIFTMPDDLAGYGALVDAAGHARKERVLASYPARTDDDARTAATRYVTDRDFVCPARSVAARRPGRSWLYRVSAPPTESRPGVHLGAYHGVDVRFLFDVELGVSLGQAGRRVGDHMRRRWVRFAATGNPNGPGLTPWSAYDPARPRELDLGVQIQQSVPRGCELFDGT
jgi:para-nitrobenzyl esterase